MGTVQRYAFQRWQCGSTSASLELCLILLRVGAKNGRTIGSECGEKSRTMPAVKVSKTTWNQMDVWQVTLVMSLDLCWPEQPSSPVFRVHHSLSFYKNTFFNQLRLHHTPHIWSFTNLSHPLQPGSMVANQRRFENPVLIGASLQTCSSISDIMPLILVFSLSNGSGFPVCAQFIHSSISLALWQKHLFRSSPPAQSLKKKIGGGGKCLAKMFGTEFHAKARASGRQTSHSADPNQGRDFSTAA